MTLLARIYKAIQRAQQARAEREMLARLDYRTLRDLGIETWSSKAAGRLAARRMGMD